MVTQPGMELYEPEPKMITKPKMILWSFLGAGLKVAPAASSPLLASPVNLCAVLLFRVRFIVARRQTPKNEKMI